MPADPSGAVSRGRSFLIWSGVGLVAVGLVTTVATALAGEGGVGNPFRIILWVLTGLGCGALLLQLLERIPPEQRHTVRRPVAAGAVVAVSTALLAWLERPAWLLDGPGSTRCPTSQAGPDRSRWCSVQWWWPRPDTTTGPPDQP